MSARRKAIRERLKSILVAAATDAGSNVFTNRASPTFQENLPGIFIYPRSEVLEDLGVSPKEYKRSLEIAVEIKAIGPEDPHDSDGADKVEDQLDDIGEQIEDHLSRDDGLGDYTDAFGNGCAMVDRLDLRGVEYEFEGDGQQPIGSLRLIYIAEYAEHRPLDVSLQTDAANLTDLDKVNADWAVGHHDEPPDSEDEARDELDFTP